MARKDKNDSKIFEHLLSLEYTKNWGNYAEVEEIDKVFSTASKSGSGERGYPDHIYINEDYKLLIIVEDKTTISKHCSIDGVSDPENYAVDGVVWYMNKFITVSDEFLKEFLVSWEIIGLAISGDIDNSYNHKISTFAVLTERGKDGFIQKVQELNNIHNILNEDDYINICKNLVEETTIKCISESSKKINNWLRPIDSQKRPILLSALMIALFEIKTGGNSFITEYNGNTAKEIIGKLQNRVDAVLESENIPEDKRNILKAELEFIKVEEDLKNNSLGIVKNILNELRTVIIPLFSKNSNYDIIGKFYEDFLKFAGVANVKKGIVLTPHHITTLFTELIEMHADDVILDPCCGTGSFLIAAMNKIIDLKRKKESDITEKLLNEINQSGDCSLTNVLKIIMGTDLLDDNQKNNLIEEISNLKIKDEERIIRKINEVRSNQLQEVLLTLKSRQLIGFEKNSTMYSLAISNMLFRGDGKSQIFNIDYFDSKVMYELNDKDKKKTTSQIKAIKESTILGKLEADGIKPTIGFINPPYAGKDSKDNPTKKEIQFLTRMLDHVSRYGVIIAPLSTYFKDDDIREKILEKHTLKYVINMPKDLFMPNAATNTAIAVFEVNKPHKNKEVVMYDLKDDGYVLSKSKGRTNLCGKWDAIKTELLTKINQPDKYIDNITLVKKSINPKDEWIIQAHSITDYSTLSEDSIISCIKEYMAFNVKKEMNLIEDDISEVDFMSLLTDFYTNTVLCSECGNEFDNAFNYCPYCGTVKGGIINVEKKVI